MATDVYVAAARTVLADARARAGRVVGLAVDTSTGVALLRCRLAGGSADEVVGSLPAEVSTVAGAVVVLADLVQELLIEVGPDTTWPGCLPGHRHPPVPRLVGGVPVWACDRGGAVAGPIGATVTGSADSSPSP